MVAGFGDSMDGLFAKLLIPSNDLPVIETSVTATITNHSMKYVPFEVDTPTSDRQISLVVGSSLPECRELSPRVSSGIQAQARICEATEDSKLPKQTLPKLESITRFVSDLRLFIGADEGGEQYQLNSVAKAQRFRSPRRGGK